MPFHYRYQRYLSLKYFWSSDVFWHWNSIKRQYENLRTLVPSMRLHDEKNMIYIKYWCLKKHIELFIGKESERHESFDESETKKKSETVKRYINSPINARWFLIVPVRSFLKNRIVLLIVPVPLIFPRLMPVTKINENRLT